jgi:hypothetical protein
MFHGDGREDVLGSSRQRGQVLLISVRRHGHRGLSDNIPRAGGDVGGKPGHSDGRAPAERRCPPLCAAE